MKYTRVDTARLSAAVAKAIKKLEEADELLEPYLELMTDSERVSTPKPPDGFPAIARQVVGEATRLPEFSQGVGFSGAAVTEDLNNIDALQRLEQLNRSLGQKIADSRLSWTAEAFVPLLDLYHAAKRRAESDGSYQPLVDTIAPLFASRRKRKSAEPEK